MADILDLDYKSATGPEPLSPAAQAVLDGASNHWPGGSNHPSKRACVAAALLAVADQVVPHEPTESRYFTTEAIRLNKQSIRQELLRIAAELNGQA